MACSLQTNTNLGSFSIFSWYMGWVFLRFWGSMIFFFFLMVDIQMLMKSGAWMVHSTSLNNVWVGFLSYRVGRTLFFLYESFSKERFFYPHLGLPHQIIIFSLKKLFSIISILKQSASVHCQEVKWSFWKQMLPFKA